MFYRKVPGYGKNEVNWITGPRTYYRVEKTSRMPGNKPYDNATLAGMTWDEWTPAYVPAY